MSYRSPVADILFSLKHVAGLDAAVAQGLFGDLDSETVASVISEAGRFATDVIAPLNWPGDVEGARYENGVVTMPKGFREAYKSWAEAGWAGVTAKPEYGGMGLPHVVNFACGEIWNGASMGFALCPLLSEGALGALNAYASEELRETYMRKLISGEWTGTMNLTEPQAGSDLNAVKSRAERAADDSRFVSAEARRLLEALDAGETPEGADRLLSGLAAAYFLVARTPSGRVIDPVARFHLGNGARLERLNLRGDSSASGKRQSLGLMVNYLYDLDHIETNHEAFANRGVVAASSGVRKLAAPFVAKGSA